MLPIGFIEELLLYLSSITFQKSYSIWQHFYCNHATKELFQGQPCKIKKTPNFPKNANQKEKLFNYTLMQIVWTLCATYTTGMQLRWPKLGWSNPNFFYSERYGWTHMHTMLFWTYSFKTKACGVSALIWAFLVYSDTLSVFRLLCHAGESKSHLSLFVQSLCLNCDDVIRGSRGSWEMEQKPPYPSLWASHL